MRGVHIHIHIDHSLETYRGLTIFSKGKTII